MVATNGDHRLGGKDWDDIIVNHVAEEFDRAHGENPLARSAKLSGSAKPRARREDPALQLAIGPRSCTVTTGKSVKVELTREEFETMNKATGREVQGDLRNRDAAKRR